MENDEPVFFHEPRRDDEHLFVLADTEPEPPGFSNMEIYEYLELVEGIGVFFCHRRGLTFDDVVRRLVKGYRSVKEVNNA